MRATAQCRRCSQRCSSPRVFISLGRHSCYLWSHSWGHKRDNIAYFCLDCFLDEDAYKWLNTGAWKSQEYRNMHSVGDPREGGEDCTIEELLTSSELTFRTFAKIMMDLSDKKEEE